MVVSTPCRRADTVCLLLLTQSPNLKSLQQTPFFFCIIYKSKPTPLFASPTSPPHLRPMAATLYERRFVAAVAIADVAICFITLSLVALMLLMSMQECAVARPARGGGGFEARPCDEIYLVGEGETLQTISERCGDPFIVEENPHIHDPDDVFPGLVIKLTPLRPCRVETR